jgi:hypothetical protein
MEEFAAAVRGIAGLGEAGLQRFDFGMLHEIGRALVAAGSGRELTGENRRATGRAVHTGGVSVGEIDATGCKFVDVRRECGGPGVEATDPIVHVVHRNEEDVWLGRGCGVSRADRHQDDKAEQETKCAFHGAISFWVSL